MTLEKDRERQKQKQREEQKKRSLHRKHRDRRKRDIVPNIPFIIAYQGDPSIRAYCEDVHDYQGYHTYGLNPIHENSAGGGLVLLNRYKSKKITRLYQGQILVYRAGER